MSREDLFTTTLEERREAFVRKRFNEVNVFCREDVEEWLAEQRQADEPDLDFNPMWYKVYALVEKKIKHCQDSFERILTLASYPAFWEELAPEVDDKMHPLLRALWPSNKKIFQGSDGRHVLGCFGKSFYVFSKPTCITPASTLDIVKLLFVSWGKIKETESYVPYLYQARQQLCDWCQQLIDQARRKAEADFDRAVAVSEDGKSIVAAHRVFLYSLMADNTIAIYEYPASAFQRRKIKLHGRSDDLKRGLVGSCDTLSEDVDPREEVLHRVKTTILQERKTGYIQMLGHVQLKDFSPEYLALPVEERFDAAEEYHVRCFCSSLLLVQGGEFPEGGELIYQGAPLR